MWQGFSPAFDMWIEETWISFCRGAHVVVGTREECRDTSSLGALWKLRNISVVHAVPTLMGILALDGSDDAGVPSNVRLIVSFTSCIALDRIRLVIGFTIDWITLLLSEPRWRSLPAFASHKIVTSGPPSYQHVWSD